MITIARLIRRRELLIYLWAGWTVDFVGGPHQAHAYLATREPVT